MKDVNGNYGTGATSRGTHRLLHQLYEPGSHLGRVDRLAPGSAGLHYHPALHAWDFRAGSNVVLAMHHATRQAERTIAVLSPNYLSSAFSSTVTQAEWAAVFARDPTSEESTLLPVQICPCYVEGLLGQIIMVDLLDRAEQEAKELLPACVQRLARTSRIVVIVAAMGFLLFGLNTELGIGFENLIFGLLNGLRISPHNLPLTIPLMAHPRPSAHCH